MEREIEDGLDRLGLNPTDKGRYWTIHCPSHDDRNKSAVCFKDGWICCFAGCPRVHINQILRREIVPRNYSDTERKSDKPDELRDYTEFWLQFDPIPGSVSVKGVPAVELNKRGWRYFPGGWGYEPGLFIPYFNLDRSRVIYWQIRHPNGAERRFSFPRGCSPQVYGLEQIPKMGRYLPFTEGSRDSVILGMAGIPAVALPSASSHAHLKRMAEYAKRNGKILLAISDNDDAGSKLLEGLDVPFIDARTPVGKDIGDLYQQQGIEGVKKYYEIYN